MKLFAILSICLLLMATVLISGCVSDTTHSDQPPAGNVEKVALQNLDQELEEAVDGISLNDLEETLTE
jgi:uncharacterized protein YceK